MTLAETPGRPGRRPPRLGEHGREALTEAGFDRASVDRLFAAGVVAADDNRRCADLVNTHSSQRDA